MDFMFGEQPTPRNSVVTIFRSAPFPIQRRPLQTSVVLEDINQSPLSRTRSLRSTSNNYPDHPMHASPLASAHSATSLNDTNVFDDDSSGSMFEEHFEVSSFVEAHSEYDVTYDATGLNFHPQNNATSPHSLDLFEADYPEYTRNSRDHQHEQQNRSFTTGLEFGQDCTEENNACENDDNEEYHFIRENLGRRSFPLDKASHVIVQNEQMRDHGLYCGERVLQKADAVSAASKIGISSKCVAPLTCLAIWDHVTFDPTELQFKCGDLIEILDNSDRHWWRGKLHEQEGWFPNAFVHETCNNLDSANKSYRNKDVFKVLHRRALAIRELLYTERFYVSTIKTVLDIYQSAMKKSRYIKAADVDTIFGNLPEVYHFHLLILSNLENCAVDKFKLETRFQDWCVSSVFLQNINEFIRVYTIYCNNYQRAVSTLNYLENKKTVGSLLQKCRKKHGQILSLQHFLLTPIQKICRYQMQLTELLKNTTEQHPDYLNLKMAAEEMRRAAFEINEKRRSSDFNVLSTQSKTLTLGSLNLSNHNDVPPSPTTEESVEEPGSSFTSKKDEETTKSARRKTSATKRLFRLFSHPMF